MENSCRLSLTVWFCEVKKKVLLKYLESYFPKSCLVQATDYVVNLLLSLKSHRPI